LKIKGEYYTILHFSFYWNSDVSAYLPQRRSIRQTAYLLTAVCSRFEEYCNGTHGLAQLHHIIASAEIDSLCGSRAVSQRLLNSLSLGAAPTVEYLSVVLNDGTVGD